MLDYAGLGMGSGFPYCRYLETEDGGQVGNGLTLKVFRKHIKRLVNYAEAGDGEKIREELKRIVPVMSFQLSVISNSILIFMFLHLGI